MYLLTAHQARNLLYTVFTTAVIVLLCVPAYGQSEPNSPIDTCGLIQKPRRGQPVVARDASDAHKQFVRKLKGFTKTAKKLRKSVEKTWDIPRSLLREYRNQGITDLHPREGRRLRMPKNKRVQPLFDAAWWLTSMQKAAHELYQMKIISGKFTKELATLSNDLYGTLLVMNIRIRRPRALCLREQTIDFPLKQRDVTKESRYAYIVLRDIERGVKRMAKILRKCKVSVSNKKSRLRCRKVKSIFYSKKSKTVLGTWQDIFT
ncbi:uncharacterized protein LOC124113435 isoform X1 [Haliotis rufescens]|uniref:uncharacterized protein LOC124113435 isoform X1 n=1 Tax=Haliotis rufescens TaxID=6454 RepID=UPI00201EFB7A|nr:uncharacterized protein LOC124113435 isoform X1 [Haliotis rufescens]